MFKRRTNSDSSDRAASRRPAPPSVIARGMHVLGNIISDGALDIDGNIDGNVRGETVTVREHGIIRGDVMGENVHIYGKVEGLVKARSVSLYADCQVRGTIMHETLMVEDGANVDGKFKRMNQLALPAPEKKDQVPPTVIDAVTGGIWNNDNDNDEPTNEAERKILENLRLIS